MRKAFLNILCLFIYLHCCTWHGYFKQTFYPDNTLFSFTSYSKEGNFEVEMVSLKTSSLWTKINKDNLLKKRQLVTSHRHCMFPALFLPFHLLQFGYLKKGTLEEVNYQTSDCMTKRVCKQVRFDIVHDQLLCLQNVYLFFFISNQYCYTTSQTESSRLATSPRNIYFLARLSTYDKSCGFLQKLKAYKSIKM